MMATYKEDMAKALEVIANYRGISTTYEKLTESERAKRSKQQNLARAKRFSSQKEDDADGPPDTKRKHISGTYLVSLTRRTSVSYNNMTL